MSICFDEFIVIRDRDVVGAGDVVGVSQSRVLETCMAALVLPMGWSRFWMVCDGGRRLRCYGSGGRSLCRCRN